MNPLSCFSASSDAARSTVAAGFMGCLLHAACRPEVSTVRGECHYILQHSIKWSARFGNVIGLLPIDAFVVSDPGTEQGVIRLRPVSFVQLNPPPPEAMVLWGER